MALGSLQDREINKFTEVSGEVTVRVTDSQSLSELQSIAGALGVSSGSSVRSGAYITGVVPSVETDVFSYTVPSGKYLKLSSIYFGGNNIGKFRVYVDNVDFWIARTMFGENLFSNIPFFSYRINTGQVVKVTVENPRLVNGEYESILIGELLNV